LTICGGFDVEADGSKRVAAIVGSRVSLVGNFAGGIDLGELYGNRRNKRGLLVGLDFISATNNAGVFRETVSTALGGRGGKVKGGGGVHWERWVGIDNVDDLSPTVKARIKVIYEKD
jgi:hypothetical protein